MLQNKHFVEITTPENAGLDTQSTVMRLKCNFCKGEGTLRTLIYPYRQDEQYDITECPNCKGSVWLDAVVTVKFEPVKYEIKQSEIDEPEQQKKSTICPHCGKQHPLVSEFGYCGKCAQEVYGTH
ncbi:hypothetical protein [Paludibacter sp.]|uniref:hypothetical protein n=1 Tax=Paludibacter sp. TaxID=1898105 RepID=UPI0013553387|nr:hypothetical protein [Paludibacter sp.]MTK53313.1 hypothetical protein [Paludibacter sp.]